MLPWMTEALDALVSCESPSSDQHATRACGELAAELVLDKLGCEAERIELGGATHWRWTFGVPSVVVLGHLDTVWPLGTLSRWPFQVDADRASGPGAFDMKAGVIQAICALALLPRLDGICLLLTSDEEVGSPTSAGLVVDTARGCRAALVCEPSAAGALKTERKGIGLYSVEVTGRAAHAGLEPEKGANASVALAHALLGAAALGDSAAGTTVTPTVLSAGTTTNTVPAAATMAVDVRAKLVAELDRVDVGLRAALSAAEAQVAGTSLTLAGGVNRPPLEATASAELFERAARVARRLGLPELQGVAVGGGSDGNFTAGAGTPTLDGLGAVGDGAHAEGEWVHLPSMAERAALLAGLIEELL